MRRKQKIDSYKKIKWADKNYNFFGDYLREKYGHTVLKLPVNADLNCPNRDGKISTKGCIFCSEDGSASPSAAPSLSITDQMSTAKNSFSRINSEMKFIAYFQAFTNTYGPPEKLKILYDEAVSFPDVIGLMIGTRPDCIDENIVSLISNYNLPETWIELGMQSSHDASLNFLNRGHSFSDVCDSVKLIQKHGIKICLHVILGIPGETREDMISTAEKINELKVDGVKIHHLHVIKNTELEKIFNKNKFTLPDMTEYISILTDFIEHLDGTIIIHRISGDREETSLIAPLWGAHKGTIQKALDDEFIKRGTWQGFFCS
ncbi:MAG: TIGR01212 family radical SAM protein [Spirochaetes bacterium]|nr:TIGR01212 family radical SAM protein [Spirochaetota bacterium]